MMADVLPTFSSRTPHADRVLLEEGCRAIIDDVSDYIYVRGPGVRLRLGREFLHQFECGGSGPDGFDRNLAIMLRLGIDASRAHPELLVGTPEAQTP